METPIYLLPTTYHLYYKFMLPGMFFLFVIFFTNLQTFLLSDLLYLFFTNITCPRCSSRQLAYHIFYPHDIYYYNNFHVITPINFLLLPDNSSISISLHPICCIFFSRLGVCYFSYTLVYTFNIAFYFSFLCKTTCPRCSSRQIFISFYSPVYYLLSFYVFLTHFLYVSSIYIFFYLIYFLLLFVISGIFLSFIITPPIALLPVHIYIYRFCVGIFLPAHSHSLIYCISYLYLSFRIMSSLQLQTYR